MFKCDNCHRVFGPGIPATSQVVETKKVQYPARYAYRGKTFETMEELADMVRPQLDPDDRRFDDLLKRSMERALEKIECIDSGGEGTEIVREIKICPVCAGDQSLKDFDPYDPKLNILLHEGTRAAKSATHFMMRIENVAE
jgi:hypothetical protein